MVIATPDKAFDRAGGKNKLNPARRALCNPAKSKSLFPTAALS
jgi:hypothetical protein